MDKVEKDKRIAVLIDADNVSEKYIKYIFDELSNLGTPTYKRIYGDFTSPQLAAWKTVLLNYSITPMQQYMYTSGKNATDAALIIDAMDILYSGNVDGFCIVSSDSDFTKLASRLREASMYVIGMGESKTPKPFRSACDLFKILDALVRTTADDNSVSAEGSDVKNKANGSVERQDSAKDGMTSILSLVKAISKIVTEGSDEDNWISLSEVGNILNKRFPDFDSRNYGYSKLSTFIKSLKQFEVETRNTYPYVRIKADSQGQNSKAPNETSSSAKGPKLTGPKPTGPKPTGPKPSKPKS